MNRLFFAALTAFSLPLIAIYFLENTPPQVTPPDAPTPVPSVGIDTGRDSQLGTIADQLAEEATAK